MRSILQASVSVAVAALIGVSAYAGTAFLAAAVGLAVLGVAAGWAALVSLPHPRGSMLVVALSGIAAVAVAGVSADQARPLAPFAVLLALSVLGAFGHELLRRDGRPRLVESVTGTFSGQVVAVLGAGWLLLPPTRLGEGAVVVGVCAASVARVVTVLPLPPRVVSWAAVAAAGAAAAVASLLLPDATPGAAVAIGLAVGAVVATMDRLLSHQPTASHSTGLLAAATAPVVVAGTAAYAAARIVLG